MLEYRLDPITPIRQRTLTVENAARSFPFYLYECGFFHMGEHYFTKRDGQDNCLMLLTTGGRGFMTWHGRTLTLTPGTLTMIHCADLQVYGTAPGGSWSFAYVHFGSSLLDGYEKLLLDVPSAPHLLRPEDARDAFESLYAVSAQASLPVFAEESHLISSLLHGMITSLEAEPLPAASDTRTAMRELAAYVNANCTLPLTLEQLSAISHLSKYHLIRVFTAQIGMTPGRYLHLCRINRAQQLLRGTDRSVADVSAAVGYADQSLFIRHFRAFHGMTPGEYRRNCIMEIDRRETSDP